MSFYNILVCCKNVFYRNRRMNISSNHELERFNNIVNTYELIEEDSIICPITQEHILVGENVQELPCGHKFSNSIYEWVKIKNECPVCRENIVQHIV